jgi:hypothetical protein
LMLMTSLINRSDCDSNKCGFELTTTLRSHDNRSQLDWFWWNETQLKWFWWDEIQIKKKVVSKI